MAPRQDPVRGRVEPFDELVALVVEVADDRRPAVGLDRRARSARRSRPRSDRSSSPAGGRAPCPRGRAVDELDLEVVPGDRPSARWRPAPRSAARGRRTPAARAATSSATIPPSEPPATSASRSMPERVERAATGHAPGRAVETAGNAAPYGRPVGGSSRRRAGRAVAAAEQVGAQDADPIGVERPPGPDERRPPVAGRVGRAGEGVDDERPAARRRARAVVAVGDGQLGQRRARRRGGTAPSRRGLEPAGPERAAPGGAGSDRVAAPVVGARRGVIRPRRRGSPSADASAVGGLERLVEVGDEVVDVLEADRQPDEVRR